MNFLVNINLILNSFYNVVLSDKKCIHIYLGFKIQLENQSASPPYPRIRLPPRGNRGQYRTFYAVTWCVSRDAPSCRRQRSGRRRPSSRVGGWRSASPSTRGVCVAGATSATPASRPTCRRWPPSVGTRRRTSARHTRGRSRRRRRRRTSGTARAGTARRRWTWSSVAARSQEVVRSARATRRTTMTEMSVRRHFRRK